MRAIWLPEIGDPDILRLVTRPRPIPQPREVLVRVAAAGVNYADVLTRRGAYQPMPELPIVPGLEIAGAIEQLGDQVTGLAVGDRVVALVGRGGYAEFAVADARAVAPLPPDISFQQAAGLPVSGMTAYHLTHTVAPVQPGMTIVDYAAAGSVGSLIIGLAKTRGARVIALAGSPAKIERARELGADHVIDYRATDDVAAQVAQLTDGHGVDVIYNSVFGETVRDDLTMLAPRGHVVWYGVAGGVPNARRLLAGMMRRFGDSPTFSLYHLSTSARYDAARHARGWQELFGYLRDGRARLPLHGVVPLAEAAAAHRDLEGRATMGKIVLTP